MMNSTLTISKMRPEHIKRLAELEQICFSQPWSEQSLADELENDSAKFLVAEINGKAVGYIGLFIVMESCYLSNIAVFPEYRRKGVATALFHRAFSEAQNHGVDFISLEVRPSNTEALQLYTSLGFEEMGLRKNFYRNPTEDAFIMTKLFVK